MNKADVYILFADLIRGREAESNQVDKYTQMIAFQIRKIFKKLEKVKDEEPLHGEGLLL